MKVALDGTPLTLENGGLRRYTEELHRALCQEFPEDEYVLLSDQLAPPTNPLLRRWWLLGLPWEMAHHGLDLFHGTDFAVPYLPLRPAVMTVHDLSPWMDASWQPAAGRVRQRTPILLRLGCARLVITPTEAVRRQVIEHFRVHPDRVVSIPEAASARFKPTASKPARQPYFLFVGTLEPRKNLPTLIEAWTEVYANSGVELVLAGRRREDCPPLPSRPGLRVVGSVDENDLASLYSAAIAVVYPSLYEGFGLPVLEAMQSGTPVITTKDPAILEISGGAAIHVHAFDVAGWISAMSEVAANQDLQYRLRAAGLERASCFSWQKTARLTHELYEHVLRQAGA
ncbi:MAG TPA: glycosyltransferase family 1 protein [Bryobacteraceae bacterium]|nr:glycosyltransferase family 1 protein [Bryobacteraceae bacterium]